MVMCRFCCHGGDGIQESEDREEGEIWLDLHASITLWKIVEFTHSPVTLFCEGIGIREARVGSSDERFYLCGGDGICELE